VAIALALLWLVWTRALKLKVSNPAYWILIAAILLGPWVEELWIAYNFDRLCSKDAGLFVNKTVEVDGYYNDTAAGVTRIVEPPYKFIEAPDSRGKYRRIERGTADEKARAIAQYVEKNNGKRPGEKEWFTQPVSENVQVTVEMNTGNVWRITKLDKPTARYQYKTINGHTPIAHQIKRFEDVVLDNQATEVLGRYTNYTRGGYWFFVSLDRPVIECVEVKGKNPLVYREVLKPAK